MSHSIKSPSNITLGTIADQQIDENTTLSNLVVYYVDEENSVNKISVTGDKITATTTGHESGSKISITPDKDFHGEVVVTVSVADVENPADKASTQFKLTVVSDGKEPVTVSPPVVVQPSSSSSGGSVNFWLLAMLGLLTLRRKR
ncbi:GlyGly-CTERM sorting domain-containing protein [Rheinheimera sp. UJ51]|nr:GlyGly-CTERM sorting domain-containing protein [Rheinheimera sp. UJ51]MCF4010919.1 GlyGly-CTERM sorting domain-containing protein [Rheinheimera sp. UJ63]